MTPMDDKKKRVDRAAHTLWDGLMNARTLWSPLGYRLTVSRYGRIQFLYKDTDLRVNLIDQGMAFIFRVESQTIDLRHLSHLPLELPNGEIATIEDYRDARYELNKLNNDYRSYYMKNAKEVVDTLRGLMPRFDKIADMVPMGEASSERTASYRLRKLARKFSTERYLQAPSEGKEYLRDHAKRIKVMVREMAEQMTPETREKLQIGNPKPLGAGLNGFVFAGSEPGVVVKAAFNLNDAIMAERVMKMEKGLECLPRVYKVLKHVRLYDGAIGCHLIYLERLRPLPVKVAKALETMLDGVMHDDNFQVKRFSPAMYMRALQKVVERAPKGSVMSWTAMQLQVILKELANQKWWHIDLHSENFCLSADGKRLKMIDLGALMDPEEVAHMWGPIAFPQEHTARVRTASDADRQERLKKAVEPELLQLAQGLLKQEDKIEALGFRMTHGGGSLLLSYQGSQLRLALRPYGARRDLEGRVYGANGNWTGKDDYLLFHSLNAKAQTMAVTVPGVLRFLRTHQDTFKKLYESDETIPEISSERTASTSPRTAASDAARKKRLLQRVTPEQESLLKALLRGEDAIESLGFKIEVRAGLIVLSWEGTALGLEIAMHGTPLLNGMPADYPEELDELVAEVRPTPVSILKFLKASADLFRTIADNAPSIPELSSET